MSEHSLSKSGRIMCMVTVGVCAGLAAFQSAEAVTPGGLDWNRESARNLAIAGVMLAMTKLLIDYAVTATRKDLVGHGLRALASMLVVVFLVADGWMVVKYRTDQAAATMTEDATAQATQAAHQKQASRAEQNIADLQTRIAQAREEIAGHRVEQARLDKIGMRNHKSLDSVFTRQQRIDAIQAKIERDQDRILKLREEAAAAETRAASVDTSGKNHFLSAVGGGDAADGSMLTGALTGTVFMLAFVVAEVFLAADRPKSLNVIDGLRNNFSRIQSETGFEPPKELKARAVAQMLMANPDALRDPSPKSRNPHNQEHLMRVFNVGRPVITLALQMAHEAGGTRIRENGVGESHRIAPPQPPLQDDIDLDDYGPAVVRFRGAE